MRLFTKAILIPTSCFLFGVTKADYSCCNSRISGGCNNCNGRVTERSDCESRFTDNFENPGVCFPLPGKVQCCRNDACTQCDSFAVKDEADRASCIDQGMTFVIVGDTGACEEATSDELYHCCNSRISGECGGCNRLSTERSACDGRFTDNFENPGVCFPLPGKVQCCRNDACTQCDSFAVKDEADRASCIDQGMTFVIVGDTGACEEATSDELYHCCNNRVSGECGGCNRLTTERSTCVSRFTDNFENPGVCLPVPGKVQCCENDACTQCDSFAVIDEADRASCIDDGKTHVLIGDTGACEEATSDELYHCCNSRISGECNNCNRLSTERSACDSRFTDNFENPGVCLPVPGKVQCCENDACTQCDSFAVIDEADRASCIDDGKTHVLIGDTGACEEATSDELYHCCNSRISGECNNCNRLSTERSACDGRFTDNFENPGVCFPVPGKVQCCRNDACTQCDSFAVKDEADRASCIDQGMTYVIVGDTGACEEATSDELYHCCNSRISGECNNCNRLSTERSACDSRFTNNFDNPGECWPLPGKVQCCRDDACTRCDSFVVKDEADRASCIDQGMTYVIVGDTGACEAADPDGSADMEKDPHIRSWKGEHFDYMGQCDLTLVHAPSSGVRIHARTTIRLYYSYMEQVAIQLSNDTLEVCSWGEHFLNGVDGALPTSGKSGWLGNPREQKELTVGGYRVIHTQENKKKQQFDIILGAKENITITSHKDLVSIKINRINGGHFGDAVGLFGNFQGRMLARDGITNLHDDIYAMGQEWQVRDDEPMLFQSVRAPQYPEKCIIPDLAAKESRRLSEGITVEEAEVACAHLKSRPQSFDDCVYDVTALNDLEFADAYY